MLADLYPDILPSRFYLSDIFFAHRFYASLTELQNARGIMDVLAEMLSALDPGNKEVSSHYGRKSFHRAFSLIVFEQ